MSSPAPFAAPAFPSPPFTNGQTFVDPATGRTYQFDASLPGWRIVERAPLDPVVTGLPIVQRVNFLHDQILLEFNRATTFPAQVAFWRWRRGISGKAKLPGAGAAPNAHIVDGFRPIQIDNPIGRMTFPVVNIPIGDREIWLPGHFTAYFNPPVVRSGTVYGAKSHSRYHRFFTPPPILDTARGRNRATKCVLKFGTSRKEPNRHREFGAASVETITIWRWRFPGAENYDGWSFKVKVS